jgi:hypothetical protein
MTLDSSAYSQSVQDDIDDLDNYYKDDYDIVSVAVSPLFSHHSDRRRQDMAVSPDLKPGMAKTAVGALLVAMESAKGGGVDRRIHSSSRTMKLEGSHHSILPSRDWMDKEYAEEEDDTIREDTYIAQRDDDDGVHCTLIGRGFQSGVTRPCQFFASTPR